MLTSIDEKDYTSFYLHWPFCLSKCPYCSFNSYAIAEIINFNEWREAYFWAIKLFAKQYQNKIIRSVYFGGGTPSLLPSSLVKDILNEIQHYWDFCEDVEITLEINPETAEESKIRGYREAGINRVSVGMQSMYDEGLAILGRGHSVEASIATMKLCLDLFKSVSVDMIYARPGHSVKIWEQELKQLFALSPHHLSLYQLTIENETVFGNMFRKGELLLPDDNTCSDLFEVTQSLTREHGLPAYEISNHAKAGHECVHNMRYWLYEDYIGIGPGAHSRVTIDGCKYALAHETNPRKWLRALLEHQEILEERLKLTPQEQAREAILVGLRMTDGLDYRKIPLPLEQCIDYPAMERLIEEGYIELEGNILRCTHEGRKCLNSVLLLLLASL
ncbi:MAG: radical SAM family heme chaperone HemW [Holosporales bacterium]|jgi:oxygen-independent coproporphyrinogen-3 oxidase|nr:radical SAM family heme chaperone HemW [Holosporales bacterium]